VRGEGRVLLVVAFRGSLMKSFDKLGTNGNGLIPLAVSRSNALLS
jgi:hypothetical protein